jgi:hypothetical protein
MLAALPDWVNHDRYAIEAIAPPHATKDQYRLMMQALLAERFGVKLHVEQREMRVLAMTLISQGRPALSSFHTIKVCHATLHLRPRYIRRSAMDFSVGRKKSVLCSVLAIRRWISSESFSGA